MSTPASQPTEMPASCAEELYGANRSSETDGSSRVHVVPCRHLKCLHHAEWVHGRPFIQVLSMPIHRLDHMLVTVAVGTLSEVVGSGKTATLRHVQEQLGKEKSLSVEKESEEPGHPHPGALFF